MVILSKGRITELCLRKRLEYCYDHEKLEEAIRVGNLLDKMQCTKFRSEQEEDTILELSISMS